MKRTVVEREQNILSLDEAKAHEKECNKAMLDELTRWLTLGAFERIPRQHATNVIDARCVGRVCFVSDVLVRVVPIVAVVLT